MARKTPPFSTAMHFYNVVLKIDKHMSYHYYIIRDTHTQSKPRARAFSMCGLVACVEILTERKEK